VAYLSMMSHINDLVERRQQDARQTLVVTDEGHIITTNPLLARYVVKITKMWRKLGAWFWIATQNLEDFPDASRRMLNMMEWWLCLVMPKEEVEQIARFNLEAAVGRPPGCVRRGVWQGTTRRNSGPIATSCNAARRRAGRALVVVAALTQRERLAYLTKFIRDSMT